MANPYDINPYNVASPAPQTDPGILSAPKPALVNFSTPAKIAPPVKLGFDATPLGHAVNFFADVPQATYDTGKNLIQSLFRIPAEFSISAGQAGAAIADHYLGTDYTSKAVKDIPTDGLSTLLGSEPLKGYAPQIEELSKSIAGSSFAKKTGLDKGALPLAFAGIVGGTAINFDAGGGQENVINAIAKQTDPARIFNILVKSGVEKTIAAKAANHLAEVSAPAEIKATLDTLQASQAVAEATQLGPQLAKDIREQVPNIPPDVVNDIADRATKLPNPDKQTVEDFINKELEQYKPAESPTLPALTEKAPKADIAQEGIAPELQPLAEEAKKYTSAEEFVKAQGEVFRGQGTKNPNILRNTLGDGKYFTTSGKVASEYGTVENASLAGLKMKDFKHSGEYDDFVQATYLKMRDSSPEWTGTLKSAQKIMGEARNAVNSELQKQGFDGITTKVAGDNVSIVFPESISKIKTKSQLIDFYNKVKGGSEIRSELPKGTTVSKGVQQTAAQKAAQELAAASAGPRAIENKIPLPPSVGDIIANGKHIPAELTPGHVVDDLAKGPDAASWQSLIKGFKYNAGPQKKAHLFDKILSTPEFVLEKVGLARGAEMLQDAKYQAGKTLRKEITTINGWEERVRNQVKDGQTHTQNDTAKLIFQYLDGKEKEVVPEMTDAEHQVAQEIRVYLQDWAKRLGLPEDNQISRYITHIFERSTVGKDTEAFIDPELAALMAEQPAKSVYNPFLQKRLGKQGYIEDVWRALDAYVKRASRKEAMDPALEQLAKDASHLDDYTYKYVTDMSHRINMRPTEIEKGLDNFIKQTPIGYYFTERPTTYIAKAIRQVFYRGTLGLNFSAALRNLTQGANTYAKLGEKYTVLGYSRLFSNMVSRNLDELFHEGILDENLVQDRTIGAVKKKVQMLDKGLFSLFQVAETINRGAAYYGAKAQYLAKNSRLVDGVQVMNKGASEEQAIKYARRLVRETQFAFGAVDTPVAMNDDLVKTALQLQTFNIKQAEFLRRMVGNKEYLGLIRWTGASLGMVYTIGRLFGMTPSQLIPTIGIGGAPLTSFMIGLTETTSSNPQTHAAGVSQLKRSGFSTIPAGAQLKKTGQALIDLNRGRDLTPTGKFRFRVEPSDAPQALLFGPNVLPAAKKYYDSLPKVDPITGESSTKRKGGNPYNL